ncbi:MFS general substrate transporter [Gautieria morchelliformis]|nr:MFS general substrate transporter [Gautieria morchelliformis]
MSDSSIKSDAKHLGEKLFDLKLDTNGLPLIPQPSDDPADPLNWPLKLKILVLVQVSFLAALGTLNTSIINPAYVPMAKDLGVSTIVASYQTSVVIALNGIGPFIWNPLANVYGRRPIYLFTTLLGFASAVGCGFSKTFTNLLVSRVFNGLFPIALSLGAASVTDMFFIHQRGRAMGFFTVFLTTGAHIAPILGGVVGQFLGWQWCFFLAAILDGAMLLVIFFCLPETLYIRSAGSYSQQPTQQRFTRATYIRSLFVFRKFPGRTLHLRQFFLPSLRMARYPSVLLPAIYYGMAYGFGSILPAVTVSHVFSQHFNFSTLVIGLAYGGALTVGGLIGELAGGMVVDYIIKHERQKHKERVEPEVRLKAIWTGEILVPVGLLMYGFGVQYRVNFMMPIVAMGIAMAGVQVITTVAYVYAIECYRQEASDTSQLINLIRQEFGFTFAFYAIRMGDKIGYQFTFLIFSIIGSGVAFAPIVWLMFRGKEMRESLGKPDSLDLFGYSDEII